MAILKCRVRPGPWSHHRERAKYRWLVPLIVKDLQAAVGELRKQKATFISAEPVDIIPLGESGPKGVLIRDPEGTPCCCGQNRSLFRTSPRHSKHKMKRSR